ncbi:recombinase [Elizabethkingia anophelis]|uniref:Recombinase n=2 Tax=Elizabethkingia anophelis TaxID=1117645 RepID=A0A494J7Q2_9FLAO|nr:site-specific integrase [Elizabethkingia anophelis]AQX50868.1 recombinase [Elizabethkingia anophelis]MCT4197204.1 site-specific integrase [Elizabethkingia anophelis]MCT4224852.1 site-specific integrase [Elizabethkingia anophelis]MCT4306443.1 site-specific integrase [Elizabethkingia anophelis]MDV2472223.1 recombinase [Elizabethkingia anophelis]
MNATVYILFYIKRTKTNKEGHSPIYVRVTIQSRRFEFSTNKFIHSDKWNTEAAKVRGNNEEARAINSHLDHIRSEISQAERTLFKKGIPVNTDTLRNQLFPHAGTARMLVSIFQDHNNKIQSLIGQEYAPGTLERYKTSLKHTVDFLQTRHTIQDIDIRKIDHAFIMDYEFYLRNTRKCNNNTAVKYIKNFRKIINICIANGWLDRDPFVNYKSKIREVERSYLTQEEVHTIYSKVFATDRLNIVRDIFVFSCFTGLAYIDVRNLTPFHINIGIDGGKWIFTHRQKTDTPSRIPLLPIAIEIIQKYEDHPQCSNEGTLLPILSNQKMNAYLKEIADICGIRKELTFHIARHTFATTITLSNGVPIESVSKMLGHKNLRTTQHYAKILDQKISHDMQMLKEKFEQIPLNGKTKIR